MIRTAGTLLLCLALAGCGAARAANPSPPEPVTDPVSLPAVGIAARLDPTALGTVPDVVGVREQVARSRLDAAGLQGQLVAFDDTEVVSAQYPEPGRGLPADGVVVVWLGTPPVPPPPPPPPPPAPEPEPPAAGEREPTAGATEVPDSSADDSAPAAQPGSGATPGLTPPTGPTPPRTNPRVMPALDPGTALSGPASWYGPGFAGKTTACGGTFDPGALTLASRELPCGTKVLVTGPSGASVTATATDWGPAEWTNRRFDLSQATFAAIHPLGAGVVNVRVEVLG